MSDTMRRHAGDPESYTFWTWLIAVCIVIYLIWMWQHGRGPQAVAACCNGEVVTSTASAPFQFSASAVEGFNATGDVASVAWSAKSQALLDWLKGGSDWKISGDAKSVTLTGTVENEETKTIKGDEAQAFFGSDVSIDNQLVVQAPQTSAPEPVVANATPPELSKIYFDTGAASLPAGSDQAVATIVDWAKNNPNAKIVISGFHDARGNADFNHELAKKRAMAVSELLVQAGVNADRIELRKPQSTEGDGSLQEARRVEISVE
jgi:outer membrane protein OmpA-like peptidoglycan-associated protein